MRGKELEMHVLISADESVPFLKEELARTFPRVRVDEPAENSLRVEFPMDAAESPTLVFSRQTLPDAEEVHAESIGEWSRQLFARMTALLPEAQPWRLHLMPHYGEGIAGQNRCRLIREALFELLQKKRRSLMKALQDAPTRFAPEESLVQLLLIAPDHGFISVASAPLPSQAYRLISPFVKGDVPVASDKAAPSRAFAKLVEAELRLGRRIAINEICVDLGASPGSWSHVALQRGAQVTAVDRSPLRGDLMHDRRLTFRQGDAFSYEPPAKIDWLLCDVIAAPERSIGLLLDWLERGWTRRFVVTIKFRGDEDYGQLERLKQELPPRCEEFFLTRLCANKNEACAFGIARS